MFIEKVRCFDFILIRLGDKDVERERHQWNVRFHTGSIKSALASKPDNFQHCFNSILVRLKVKAWLVLVTTPFSVSIPYWFD